jgi:hypothetical protein
MDWVLILLRLVHIGLGTVWVGMMLFNVVFLMPSLREAGPAGGAVMAGLQRRRMMTILPLIALVTILSGFWLVERVWGGMSNLTATRTGLAFTAGAVCAVIAFLLGILVMRPAMMRSARLMNEMGSVPESERAARMATLAKLRTRGAATANVVAVLLVLALGAMAVARYL